MISLWSYGRGKRTSDLLIVDVNNIYVFPATSVRTYIVYSRLAVENKIYELIDVQISYESQHLRYDILVREQSYTIVDYSVISIIIYHSMINIQNLKIYENSIKKKKKIFKLLIIIDY